MGQNAVSQAAITRFDGNPSVKFYVLQMHARCSIEGTAAKQQQQQQQPPFILPSSDVSWCSNYSW